MSAATQVIIPDADESQSKQVLTLVGIAEDYLIEDADIRKYADADIAQWKGFKKAIDDERKFLKEPLLEGGRRIDKRYMPMIEQCDRAISILTSKVISFDHIIAAARAEEQRKVEAAAAEQRRKLEEQAKALAAAGATEAAAAVQEAAVLVQAPVIPLGPDRDDTSTTKAVTWGGEVIDLMELAKAVVAGTVPLEAIEANQTYLNGRARLEKAKLAIPGVKAVGKEGLRARRAA